MLDEITVGGDDQAIGVTFGNIHIIFDYFGENDIIIRCKSGRAVTAHIGEDGGGEFLIIKQK